MMRQQLRGSRLATVRTYGKYNVRTVKAHKWLSPEAGREHLFSSSDSVNTTRSRSTDSSNPSFTIGKKSFSTVGEIAECSCSCFGYIFYLPSDCICFGQFWVLYLQCNENPLPSHKRTNGHLPLELDCKYMWIVCFIAAVKLHHHTEQIANFHEHVFKFIILQEYFDYSFWLCVASAVVHVVNMLVVRISGVRFPTLKTKTEEANVTPEDLMY
uniref:uncharacterized protein isoform X1 n=1 Tax=Pristiophorus japonicus TaxID=55135 RepID=UPI00398EE50F